MAQQQSSEEEKHYRSLIDLFKYCVTFAGILFTAIAFWVSYVTYKDGQEMRTDRKEARKEILDNLKEMKDEIRSERERMDQKANQSREELAAREKELSDKQTELENSIANLINRSTQEISATKGDALRQIAGVKNEATTIARTEAKNRINEVFQTQNLEGFIETVAKDKLEPKIQNLINKSSVGFENQINESQLLSRLTSGIRDPDNGYVVYLLDSLKRVTKNNFIKDAIDEEFYFIRNTIIQGKAEEYNEKYYKLSGDSLVYQFFKQYSPKYATIPLPNEASILREIVRITIDSNSSSTAMFAGSALVNRLTGAKLHAFDFESIKKAYADYEKQRYPLRMGNIEKPKEK